MENHTNAGRESELPTFSWIEVATGFWEEFSSITNETRAAPDTEGPSPEENSVKDKHRIYQTWKTGLKSLNSFIQMMTQQDDRNSVSDSMESLIELLSQITTDSSENLLEFQNQLLNSISKIGENTKAYNFDDLDQRVFESFRKLYENEFKRYLYIPKLGLPRFHLERITVFIDKFNIYYSHLNELIYLFFVPLEKTNRVMQAKIDDMMNQEDFVEDPDAPYNEWIKMLEGHYLKLLQSAEYNGILKKTIDSLADYRKAKDEVLYQLLKELPIPTNREMDDVYKELYMMKKQIKELSDQLNQMNSR